MVETGSPRDFGPAATMFPDINFVAYHSGFEPGDGFPPTRRARALTPRRPRTSASTGWSTAS